MRQGRVLCRAIFCLFVLGACTPKPKTPPSFGAGAPATPDDGWLFTPGYAIHLPSGWKLISQSDVDGIGHELIVGKGPDHYLRIFMSGDALSMNEFGLRMGKIVAQSQKDLKESLLEKPRLVPFQKDGARLNLVFRSQVKGRDLVEAHWPLTIGGKGLDVNFVAPFEQHPAALREAESCLLSLEPYWIPGASPHKKDPPKT